MTVRGSSASGTAIAPASVSSSGAVIAQQYSTQVANRTGNFTLGSPSSGVNLVDATAASVTVSLIPAANIGGFMFTIKKIDASANTVTIDPNGAETIDGATTKVLSTQWSSVTIQAASGSWYIISSF